MNKNKINFILISCTLLLFACRLKNSDAYFVCHENYIEDYREDISITIDLKKSTYHIVGKSMDTRYIYNDKSLERIKSNGKKKVLNFYSKLKSEGVTFQVYSEDEEIIDGLIYTVFKNDFGPVLTISPYWPGSYCSFVPILIKKEFNESLLLEKLDSLLLSKIPLPPIPE